MTYDMVTAMPEITIEIREVSTEGIGIPLSRSLKLKPKNFFKSVIMAPLLNKQVHHFILFDQFNTQTTAPKENKEDLKSYTNRVLTPKKTYFSSKVNSHHKNLTKNEISEYAHFNPEIDLHIENLTDKHSKMTNSEILNLQLKHYEKFMDQAYRLGVPRVFVIHGLGKGTLRDAIATRLFQDQRIERFINEYHPKYGFGATEVIF
jgi:hypothetical protein